MGKLLLEEGDDGGCVLGKGFTNNVEFVSSATSRFFRISLDGKTIHTPSLYLYVLLLDHLQMKAMGKPVADSFENLLEDEIPFPVPTQDMYYRAAVLFALCPQKIKQGTYGDLE